MPCIMLLGLCTCVLDHQTNPVLPSRAQGRDANAKLQRSIRAQKLRDALPTIVAGLAQRLEEWELAEGSPFMYDGKEYTVGCCRALVVMCWAVRPGELSIFT